MVVMSNKFFESIGGAPAYSTVAVAVKGSVGDAVGGAASRRALRWTVENLLPNVDRLVLVHVMPNVTTIPSPSGSKIRVEELEESVVAMYKRDLRKEYEQVFVPFKRLCGSSKVETLLMEHDDPAKALLKYVSDSEVECLVLGSCSSSFLTRKKGQEMPLRVLGEAPETCETYVICKDRILTKSTNQLSPDSSSSFRIPQGAEAYTETFSRTRSDKTGLSASSMSSSGRKHSRRPASLPHSNPVSRVYSDAQSSTDIGLVDDEHTRSVIRHSLVSGNKMQLNPGANIKTPKSDVKSEVDAKHTYKKSSIVFAIPSSSDRKSFSFFFNPCSETICSSGLRSKSDIFSTLFALFFLCFELESMAETMVSRGKSSEVVRWEKYLPKTVLSVLLVESDDSTRQIITALLQKCSYKVVAVSDGLAAWETLKEKSNEIDLILTELDLPAISGFALLALVMEHEACKNIPVIMMSSEDSMTMVLKCMLKGAADYLIKPMRKNELKNLWQHVWRRLAVRDGHNGHGLSLPASQQNLEDSDETSADHSDQGSGAQATTSCYGNNRLMEDVTMDLIGGIDKRAECFYGDNTRDEYVGPELGLSLKRSCSGSFEKQDQTTKQQKLSLSDESVGITLTCRYENSQPAEKADAAVEPSSSAEPKTPSESHEKLLRFDYGSATTSSNHENMGSSSISGQNELSFRNQVGSESTNDVKAKEQEEEGCGLSVEQRRSQREAALMKFRLKRKDRCFDKKVRYQSRKKLAEQRPRVKGQFVRAVMNSDASK